MIGQVDKSPQLEMFKVPLRHIIDEDLALARLSREINWEKIVSGLSIFYSRNKGRKAIPIRKIAGFILLKDIFEMTDEGILKQWLRDPVFQYFCGEVYHQGILPFSRTELVKFRHRIGVGGMEVIFTPEVLIMIDDFREGHEIRSIPAHSSWSFIRLFRNLLNSY